MRALAWFRWGDDQRAALAHGDLIGRLPTAALSFDDARISEAHAMVSLRGGDLHLLALRGRFRVRGQVRASVVLTEGLVIDLTDDLALTVERVELPDTLLGIQGPGLPTQPLPGTVSIDIAPAPTLRPGAHPDADAILWQFDEVWRIRPRGGSLRTLRAGDRVDIGGWPLEVVEVPLRDAGSVRTRADFAAPLHLSACVDTVTLTVGEGAPVVLGGLPGRMLAELLAIGGPTTWQAVARELWRDSPEPLLRKRWDVSLSRLRQRLRDLGARDDLVAADGAGHVGVVLRTGDTVKIVDG